MDQTTRIVVVGMAVPGLIGLVGGLLSLRPALPPGAGKLSAPDMLAWLDRPVRVGIVAALGAVITIDVAWLVSQWGVHGAVSWPPISSDDRLRIAAAVLGVLGLVGAVFLRGSGAVGPSLWALVMGAVGTAVVLMPVIGSGAGRPILERAAIIGGFGVWSAAAAGPLVALLGRGHRISAAFVLAGLGAAVGAGLMGTGSMTPGFYGFGVAAGLAGLLIAVAARRGTAIGAAAVALAAGILGTLMAAGRFLSETPNWVCVLLALVPLAALLADLVIGKRLGPRSGALVRIGAAAILAGVTVAPGIIDLVKFAAGKSDDPYAAPAGK